MDYDLYFIYVNYTAYKHLTNSDDDIIFKTSIE